METEDGYGGPPAGAAAGAAEVRAARAAMVEMSAAFILLVDKVDRLIVGVVVVEYGVDAVCLLMLIDDEGEAMQWWPGKYLYLLSYLHVGGSDTQARKIAVQIA